jgi:hypothetical protein
MGHDSRNLIVEVPGFSGAILSPVNENQPAMAEITSARPNPQFDFVFDPQLYFPRRSDRGELASWSYFPDDLYTADLSSRTWWDMVVNKVVESAVSVGANSVCSPAVISGQSFTADYYDAMRANAASMVVASKGSLRVLQTLLVRLTDLADKNRSLEIASIASGTRADGVYLVFLSDTKPRDELRDVDQLKGAMTLIGALERSGLRVVVGCSSSDLVLWKAAGATTCATGKFANLRRFSVGRFDDKEDGGKLMAYWLEESLLAFVRQSDLARMGPHGLVTNAPDNQFGSTILGQIAMTPEKPWVALGWRQYMSWFAGMERRLATNAVTARDLIRSAERNWQVLEGKDVFMEERGNDGQWLRSWLRALVEYDK